MGKAASRRLICGRLEFSSTDFSSQSTWLLCCCDTVMATKSCCPHHGDKTLECLHMRIPYGIAQVKREPFTFLGVKSSSTQDDAVQQIMSWLLFRARFLQGDISVPSRAVQSEQESASWRIRLPSVRSREQRPKTSYHLKVVTTKSEIGCLSHCNKTSTWETPCVGIADFRLASSLYPRVCTLPTPSADEA